MAKPQAKVRVQIFECDPVSFDWGAMLAKIAALPLEQRYFDRGLDRRMLAVAFPSNDTLGAWTIRNGGALDIHDGGSIRPWDLPSDVAEGAYFRFFKDGIVATARKGHGPAPTALSGYLEALGIDLDFNPVMRSDTGTYVASIDDARSITLHVDSPAGLRVLTSADETLGRSVGSLMGSTDGTRIKIELTGNTIDEKHSMWGKSKDFVQRLVGSDDLTALRDVKLTVPGEYGGTEPLDLLKDRITVYVPVDGAGITQGEAHSVLADAYAVFRERHGGE